MTVVVLTRRTSRSSDWTIQENGDPVSRIIRSVLVVSLLAAGMIGFQSSSPASAAYCVGIYRIYYNSPGSDTGSNSSLNAEWIQLHNRCSTSRSLTYAKIKDAAGHTYTFTSYALGGGRYVKVHTGKGTNTATDRYMGRSWYVWNNDKDTAYLYNRYGTLLDKCSYSNRYASSVYC
ncbi:MAG TPA: lamin tail domain-containing protein [Pseudonocardiaceae bacterium]|nr:lamin tail domain-containing protein [Pseudonocardiaceae bacterium]